MRIVTWNFFCNNIGVDFYFFSSSPSPLLPLLPLPPPPLPSSPLLPLLPSFPSSPPSPPPPQGARAAAVQAALSKHLDEDEDLPMASRRNFVPEVMSPSSSFLEENGQAASSRSSTPGTPKPLVPSPVPVHSPLQASPDPSHAHAHTHTHACTHTHTHTHTHAHTRTCAHAHTHRGYVCSLAITCSTSTQHGPP